MLDLFLMSDTETDVWNQRTLQKQTRNVFSMKQLHKWGAKKTVLSFNFRNDGDILRNRRACFFKTKTNNNVYENLLISQDNRLADTWNDSQIPSNVLRTKVRMLSYVQWHYQLHTRNTRMQSYVQWHHQLRTRQSYNKACRWHHIEVHHGMQCHK